MKKRTKTFWRVAAGLAVVGLGVAFIMGRKIGKRYFHIQSRGCE